MHDETDLIEQSGERPFWRAGLVGWLGQAAAVWLPLIVWREFYIAELDEAHLFEGSGKEAFARPATMLTFGWFYDVILIYLYIALLALPGAILLIAFMRMVEKRREKPIWIWLLVGVAAAIPLVLGLMIVAQTADAAQPASKDYLILCLVPAASGMLGAAMARRVRHPRRWT